MIFLAVVASAQGTISGKVTDKTDGIPLIGVNVKIKGTSLGTVTDPNGVYSFRVREGSYFLEFTYVGYETILVSDVKVKSGEITRLDMAIKESSVTFGEDVVVIGQKPLVEMENAQTIKSIDRSLIEAAPIRPIQQLLNTQAGVVNTPSGLHIRGGRTYETGFLIDGVSARDPMAGTGFGLDIAPNVIQDIEVTTGGVGPEVGDATTGVVNTSTKSGGDKTTMNVLYKRDNFGFNDAWQSTFNQQVIELGIGGPMNFLPGKAKKLRYYAAMRNMSSDLYTRNPPNRLLSSIYPNEFWTPRHDNRWSGFLKLNYDFSQKQKLSLTYTKTIVANQDENMLRITANDIPFVPGYQYPFELQMDNANTFTHDANLISLNWQQATKPRYSYNLTASRFFARLRGDANGRAWRPENVDTEFDPRSINDFPVSYFNPMDSVVFVNPPPGLYNNGGIATLWHHHYYEEYTFKYSGNLYSKSTFNRLNFGAEVKLQEMEWVDIVRPWIGAPVTLPDGTVSQTFRLGEYGDAWKVNPSRGGVWASNKIKFQGLIAEIGARMEYWMPGRFVDDAIENPNSQIRPEIREDYLNSTVEIFGNRFKFRFLPKISASFPVVENQMLYFNYGHSTILPHPSFVYAGLDPYYSDRSTLARLGNPNLDPEVAIAYEIGLKSQITTNDVLNVSAFWRDNYDFITTARILIPDNTGREIPRSIRINSDYARIRGLETSYIKRIGKWFSGQASVVYQVATGQSASASEALKELLATGANEDTREYYMPWDSPWEIKGNTTFTTPKDKGFFGIRQLNNMTFYAEAVYRTGRRYTPYQFQGYEQVTGRPIYLVNPDPNARWSGLGSSNFWIDINLRKWWKIGKAEIAFTFEITNLLNTRNAARINPVTGRAWEPGDPVPSEWRDPSYPDPRDPRSRGIPPNDPSRYLAQRNFMAGLGFKF